jgi:hypothetical protein
MFGTVFEKWQFWYCSVLFGVNFTKIRENDCSKLVQFFISFEIFFIILNKLESNKNPDSLKVPIISLI